MLYIVNNVLHKPLCSLACRCNTRAKAKNFKFFAIRYWAECWAGDDSIALEAAIKNETLRSNNCANPQFGNCKDKEEEECAGSATADYVYRINDDTDKGAFH